MIAGCVIQTLLFHIALSLPIHHLFCPTLFPSLTPPCPQDWILFYEDQFTASPAHLDNTGCRNFAQVHIPLPKARVHVPPQAM